MTSEPVRFTMILAATFLVTCFVFMFYDCLVEKRQKTVMNTAVRSTAVVQSLFPAEVRNHLYGDAMPSNLQDVSETQAARDDTSTGAGEEEESSVIAKTHPHCTVLFADLAG